MSRDHKDVSKDARTHINFARTQGRKDEYAFIQQHKDVAAQAT